MIFPIVKLVSIAALASAVPFKRYDNNTDVQIASVLSDVDTTITVDKYVTITLPSTTLTVPATASIAKEALASQSAQGELTVTSTIVEYTTLVDQGTSLTTPVSTRTSTITSTPTTTSTITSFVTITEAEKSDASDVCVPSTVTVTVTEKPNHSTDESSVVTSTSTFVSSYPVEAEFTLSGSTITVTSFVDVTSTQTFTTTENSSLPLGASNGTYQVPQRVKRSSLYHFFWDPVTVLRHLSRWSKGRSCDPSFML